MIRDQTGALNKSPECAITSAKARLGILRIENTPIIKQPNAAIRVLTCQQGFESEVTIKTSDLLTATRAAKFLEISRMTLWRWVRDGKIRPIEFDGQRFFHINELKTLKEAKEQQKD